MKPKPALAAAEAFLRTFHGLFNAPAVPKTSFGEGGFVLFSRGGRSVALDGNEAQRYQLVLAQLYDSLPAARRAVIGRRTVESFFQEAVLDAAELPDGTEPKQLRAVVKALTNRLNAPVVPWTFYLVVERVKLDRALTFGRLRLQATTPAAARQLRRLGASYLNATKSSPQFKASAVADFKQKVTEGLQGRALGRIGVQAVDRESAERLARDNARLAVDILAFCESLVVPASMIGLPAVDHAEWPRPPLAITSANALSLMLESPRREANLTGLFKHPKNGRLNRRISKMLASTSPTPTARRLLTAMGWAGRAAGLIRPEERFLAYLIGLESLMLGKSEGELTFRLRVRCARLLGRTPTGRRSIEQRVKTLYALRSLIVHTGLRDVTSADVEQARQLVLRAIVAVLVDRRRRKIELEEWLEDQAFA